MSDATNANPAGSGGSPSDGKAPGRRSKWVWPVLIASVALNLLILGAVGGFFLRHKGGFGRLHGGSLLSYARHLPAERRQDFDELIAQKRKELRALRRAVRQARRDAAATLTSEAFDKAGFAAALDRQLQEEVKLRRTANEASVLIGSKLSPAERREYIAWRKHRWRRRWERRRHWRNRGDSGRGPHHGRAGAAPPDSRRLEPLIPPPPQ